MSINGHLSGSSGATVSQLLHDEAARIRRQLVSEANEHGIALPSRGHLLALALESLLRRSTGIDQHSTTAPVVELTLVINADEPRVAETGDGALITGRDTDRCTCDPVIVPVTTDGPGKPVNVGRATRLASKAQRTAAWVRDGGCVFPGCDTPTGWTELHHVIHWRNGGPTDLSNLASLCRYHHALTHSIGWHMTTRADGQFAWTTPRGRVLYSQHHPPGQHHTHAA